MSKFIVDLWLDGYTDDAKREAAEEEFLKEQLDFSASSVTVVKIVEPPKDKVERLKDSIRALVDECEACMDSFEREESEVLVIAKELLAETT